MNPQLKRLQMLKDEVGRVAGTFEDAQRAREAHQHRLNEMMEETLRNITRTRAHSIQKSKHMKDATKSYIARFDHELSSLNEDFRHELGDRAAKIEKTFNGLEARLEALEVDLDKQREVRKALIEEQLGPIRDEEKRLIKALAAERKERALEEARREKMLADEIEAVSLLIDQEKFEREQQFSQWGRWQDDEQQRLAKKQYQAEKVRQDAAAGLTKELQEEAKERIECQQGIVESIATFVKRYRGQVIKEISVHDGTMPTDLTIK